MSAAILTVMGAMGSVMGAMDSVIDAMSSVMGATGSVIGATGATTVPSRWHLPSECSDASVALASAVKAVEVHGSGTVAHMWSAVYEFRYCSVMTAIAHVTCQWVCGLSRPAMKTCCFILV